MFKFSGYFYLHIDGKTVQSEKDAVQILAEGFNIDDLQDGNWDALADRLERPDCIVPDSINRFLPIFENKEMPILSVVDLDIIYYGLDLYDYFEVEFGHKRLVSDSKKYKEVPFWTSNFY